MAEPIEFNPQLLSGAHTRQELLANGIPRWELTGPLWQRLDHGRYAWAGTAPPTMMDRIRQALPLLPEGGAIGGWAAAVVHGVRGLDGETWDGKPLPVPLVMSRHQRVRRMQGVAVHRSDLEAFERVVVDGIPVTGLERTVFDIARLDIAPRTIDQQPRRSRRAGRDGESQKAAGPATLAVARGRHALEESVVWIDALLRDTPVDVEDVLAYIELRRQRSGFQQAQRVLGLVDGRSASPQESRFRLLWMLDAGLPKPLANEEILDRDGQFVAIADLIDPQARLVGEYDGAVHASAERRSKDEARADALGKLGLEVVRATSEDMGSRRGALVRRLQEKHRIGRSRSDEPRFRLGGYRNVLGFSEVPALGAFG